MLIVAAMALIALGLIALVVVVHLVVSVVNSYTSALPVPTPNVVIPEVLKALELPQRGVFLEPGCGDGRILVAAAAIRPGLDIVGIDNNPVTLTVARLKLHGRAKLVRGNLLKQDMSDASRVFTYLSPKLMSVLEPRFEAELAQGARLVSLQFPLPGRPADLEIELVNGKPHANRLYVYDY